METMQKIEQPGFESKIKQDKKSVIKKKEYGEVSISPSLFMEEAKKFEEKGDYDTAFAYYRMAVEATRKIGDEETEKELWKIITDSNLHRFFYTYGEDEKEILGHLTMPTDMDLDNKELKKAIAKHENLDPENIKLAFREELGYESPDSVYATN